METEKDLTLSKPHRWLTIVMVNAAHGLSHLNIQGISVLYPVLREHFDFEYTGIAFLSVINQLFTGPIQITFGVLTRFYRRARLLAAGSILSFIGLTGMAISQDYLQLLATKAIRGLGTSPNHPVGGAIMADSFPKTRSRAFAIYQTTGNIGGWLAPFLVGGLLHFLNWRSVVLVLGIPLLIVGLFLFLTEEPAPSTKGARVKNRRESFDLVGYKMVMRDRNSLLIALVMMVGAAGRGTGALNTYLPVLLVDRFGISVSLAAMFYAAYMFGGIIGPVSLGWLADRTSARLTLRIALFLSAASALLILFPRTPGLILGLVTFLAGFFIYSRGPLTQSMLVHLGPMNVRIDVLLSMYHTMSAITGPIWLLVTGLLVDHFGIAPALMAMALSYFLGMIILAFVKVHAAHQAI